MKLGFAFLAHSAETGEGGTFHVLGAGFDTVDASELPGRIGPWVLIVRLIVRNEPADFVVKLEGIKPDGETLFVSDANPVHVNLFEKYERETTSLTVLFRFAMEVVVPGKYGLRVTVDGNEVTTVPLYLRLSDQPASDAE
jgi:hypothetical protein